MKPVPAPTSLAVFASLGSLCVALVLAGFGAGCGGASTTDGNANADNHGTYVPPPPPPPRKLILAIGLNTYAETKYANQSAEADATAVARLLRASATNGAKSRVLVGANATRSAIRRSLDILARRAAEPGRDQIIVYFAGHGAAIQLPADYRSPVGQTKLFLVPFDGSAVNWRDTSVALDEFSALWDSKADQVVVMLDCSFGSRSRSITEQPLDQGAAQRIRDELEAACKANGVTQRGVLFGANMNEPLTVSPEGESTFASAVRAGLAGKADADGDGEVSMLELQQFVGPAVRSAAAAEYPQGIRFIGDGGTGGVLIGRASGANPASSATDTPVPDDLED